MAARKKILKATPGSLQKAVCGIDEGFYMEYASYTKIIDSEKNIEYRTIPESDFTPIEIGLFRRVYNSVLPFVDRYSQEREKYIPRYFYFAQRLNSLKEGSTIDCTLIDVRAAYWTAAFNEGLIGRELYEYGMPMKKARNAAIGALAANCHTWRIEGGEKVEDMGISRKHTAPVRDFIVERVDIMINEYCNSIGPRFLFYWVDGIFVENFKEVGDMFVPAKDSTEQDARLFFSHEGFNITCEPVTLERMSDRIGIHKQGENGTTDYFIPSITGKKRGGLPGTNKLAK